MTDSPLTIRQFCQMFQLSRATFQRHANQGRIPTFRIGRSVRVPGWFIDDLVREPGQLPAYLRGGRRNGTN